MNTLYLLGSYLLRNSNDLTIIESFLNLLRKGHIIFSLSLELKTMLLVSSLDILLRRELFIIEIK